MTTLHGFGRDLQFAFRTARKRAAFSTIAVVTLAIGIAATAVVFAVVKTVLLSPLPYGDPDRLVTVAEADSHTPNAETVSYATARDWQARSRAFDRLSLYADFGVRPILGNRVEQLRGQRVSADFFDTLGVRMYLGRTFRPEEDAPRAGNVLVLTYGTWTSLFGGDAGIVGRPIPTIDGAYLVVGVLPPDFQPLHMSNPAELPRVFMPLAFDPAQHECRSPSCRLMRAVGRLEPEMSSRAAAIDLTTTLRALVSEHPDAYAPDAYAVVRPLRDQIVGSFGMALWLLQGAVVILLVLACANVATLLLARAIPRQREMAVRSALGAARWQLLRQMLTESAVLAGTASALGIALAWAATRLIARTGTANIPRIGELAPDPAMLLFGIAACAMTTFVCGLLPAILDSRGSPSMLRASPGATGQRTHHRIIHGLIAGELALAFVLVLTVGLLGKSYWRLLQVDPGFDPRNVLTLSLLPDGVHYPSPRSRLSYFDAIVERMRTIPGVQAAGYASTLPLSHPSTAQVHVRERPVANRADAPSLDLYLVSPDFLDVLQIAVRRGRGFTAHDGRTAQPVALVSESTARRLFQGEDPIGAHIQVESRDDARPWAAIVGIVSDVHQYGLDRQPDAAVYIPFAQADHLQGWSSLAVRSAIPPARIEPAVRAAMLATDPLQPIFHLQPMATYVSLSVAQRTFTLELIAVFGALALALAACGVYGVASYVVEQRTREVGLRFALGATPAAIGWMIVRQILAIAAAGLAAGYLVSWAFTRALSTLLFGVSRLDAGTVVEVLLILLASALAAGGFPIVRAARIDPATALRAE